MEEASPSGNSILKQAGQQLLEVEEKGDGHWGVFLFENGAKWDVLSQN